MKAFYTLASASLLLIATAGCSPDLVVADLSDPDIARVFATGASIESTIGSGYQTVHNAMANSNDQPGVEVFGLESYSGLNNFNLGTRASIPRLPINNVIGAPSIFSEYTALSKEARLVVNAMDALDVLVKAGASTQTPAIGTFGKDARARSFGFFVTGTSLGWLALMYDSASIVSPGMAHDFIPPLSGAADVAKAAITMLDSALAISQQPVAASGFPLEATWLGTTNAFTLDQYQRLIRSYRARIRVGVARTPAQYAAIDWPKVVADAEAGIQADYLPNSGGSTGWNVGYQVTRYQDATWSEMSMMYMGMADTSGEYKKFIAADYAHKNGYFLVQTPDKRWPAGATRAAQNANSTAQPTSPASKPYISNRVLSLDATGEGWGVSFYDYFRYRYIKINTNQGVYPEFLKAENDLLAAEGYLKAGNIAAAAAKIDLTRVGNGGLPALTGVVTSATQPVPGGNACVPQVPTPQGTTSCGNIFEALKYEWRMELTYSGYGTFWINGRGWGDLVEGTPLEFPVPYQEMQTRRQPFYLLGPGFGSAAAKGTYGF
jgi:hypothetical protein